MGRQARIQTPGGWYHVFNRGARRQAVFVDDSDRSTFLETIAQAVERYGAEIHAYCLMGNHYHLLIRTPGGNLAEIMQWIIGQYTRRFNNAHDLDGALFRGRYRSIVVESDAYLGQLHKYIHRNPLAAGLVTDLVDYKWSSYRAFLGLEPAPSWMCVETMREVVGGFPGHYRWSVEGTTDPELDRFYSQRPIPNRLGPPEPSANVEPGGSKTARAA